MSADPLDMANNCAAAAERAAEASNQDPLLAFISHTGERGYSSAQLGACMALVSIARDLRRLVDHLERLERAP